MNKPARKGLVIALAVGVTLGGLAVRPAVAQASVLYVNKVPACSDGGTGTSAQPFCTAQAAADIVEPGQTVKITGSGVGGVTLTRSGIEGAPISIEGGTLPRLEVRGAHDVFVRSTKVESSSTFAGPAVRVTQSSRVVLDLLTVRSVSYEGGGLLIDGGSTAVALSRSALDVRVKTIVVDGAADVTIAGNVLAPLISDVTRSGNGGIELVNAPRAAVAGNTVKDACNRSISVSGDAAGTSIQNNIFRGLLVEDNGSYRYCPTIGSNDVHSVIVDAAAAPGVTIDYNIIHSGWMRTYLWAGVMRRTSVDLHAATGQAAHDLNTDPQVGSAWIDSGNADAPGQVPTDRLGHKAADYPAVPNSGAGKVGFQDRGADEFNDRVSAGLVVATKAPAGVEVSFVASVGSAWKLPGTCDIDFGDGAEHANTCSTTHVYDKTGTYNLTFVASTAGGSKTITGEIEVVEPGGSLQPTIQTTTAGLMSANFVVDEGTGPWNITKVDFDFGDGGPVGSMPGDSVFHRYTKSGTYTVKATATDAGGNTATTSTVVSTGGSGFVAHAPTRLLDTRDGTGSGGVAHQVAPYSSIRLAVGGKGAIPAGITAAAMNVTVTQPTAGGYVTVHPSGVARPVASTVNFVPGQTVPSMAVIPVGSDGVVEFYNGSAGSVHLIADVTGYFAKSPQAAGLQSIAPRRVLDSRIGVGTPKVGQLIGGSTLGQDITTDNVPEGATAVALNVTVTNPAGAGYLTVFPAGQTKPTVSNLNYVAGQTVANAVIVPVGANGAISYFTTTSTDLVVDVVGYASGDAVNFFAPISPTRMVDTRIGLGTNDAIAPRGTSTVSLLRDLPGNLPKTAVFTATAVNPRTAGYLTAFPAGWPIPNASTLNFTAGANVPNLAIAQNEVSFHNGSDGPIDLVVDVTGYLAID